jgi:hypothetical protein
MIIFISGNIFAAANDNFSLSVDPLTFFQMLLSPLNGENEDSNIRNMWLSVDLSWETAKQKELGFGLFIRGDKAALSTTYRSFFNKERQSGIFWGLFGLIEWRQMYWYDYYESPGIIIGWSLPFDHTDNVYHSLGITAGFDIGFRLRIKNFGITPYIGLGFPLFFYWGDLPSKSMMPEFNFQNATARALSIGLKLDFFL